MTGSAPGDSSDIDRDTRDTPNLIALDTTYHKDGNGEEKKH